MTVECRRVRVLLVLLCLAATAATRAEDWPQWGGRNTRNMVSDAKAIPATFEPGSKRPGGDNIDPATTENVRWTTWLGSCAYGNPTIAAGRVYVGTDDLTLDADPRLDARRGGLVKCLDEATGELIWQLAVPERRQGLPDGTHFGHQFLGTCSSPTVDGERIYAVLGDGRVACLDRDGLLDGNDGPYTDEGGYMAGEGEPAIALSDGDADIVWLFDTVSQLNVSPHDASSCSVLVYRDAIYLSTSNGVDAPHERMVSPEAPAFVALDKRTGRLVATEGEQLSRRLYHCQWCSPSLAEVNGQALVLLGGGDGLCYAFKALETLPSKPVKLEKVWSFDGNPGDFKYRDGKLIPYYDGDRRKGRGNKNDGMWVGPNEIIGTPIFANNRVYFAMGQDPAHGRGKGLLYAVDATQKGDITNTGLLWRYDGLDRSLSTVTVADGLVYAPDVAGRLHCVDADNGHCYWVYDTKAENWGSPLVADGKVYLGTKRKLFVLTAGREQPETLAEINLGSPVYTTPVVANDVLYVASQRYLWAVARPFEKPDRKTLSLFQSP